MTGTAASIGSLAVPAGSYLASAKLSIENTGSERVKVTCSLVNDKNGDSDTTEATADPIGATSWFGRGTIVLQAASTFSTAGHWLVKCTSNIIGSTVFANDLKIQAIQVGSLTNSNA